MPHLSDVGLDSNQFLALGGQGLPLAVYSGTAAFSPQLLDLGAHGLPLAIYDGISVFSPQFLTGELPITLNVPVGGKLEAALVIRLRDSIRWESSVAVSPDGVNVATSGSLASTSSGSQLDPLVYLYRDRQLAYRDLMVASAVVDVAMQVADVWNYPAPQPYLEGPTETQLPAPAAGYVDANGTTSYVRHVQPSWLPYDAIRFSDNDLYGRDSLIFELLARAAGTVFPDPPIVPADSTGTIFPDIVIWSQAEGSRRRRDVNPNQQLDVEQFKAPDQHLAERDNILAAYAARLMQVLQNPFEFATRLYVEVTGPDAREPDVYTLALDTATERVWVADPALDSRNRITYQKGAKLLNWARENLDEGHVPQLYALAIPGIVPGQELVTVPAVPETKDAQFWRSKAALVVPAGGSVSDQLILPFTASSAVTGGYTQIDACSLTVPGTLAADLGGAIDAGFHRVSVLVNPNPVVEIAGAQNASGVSGTLGGVDYPIEVASGSIDTKTYVVYGGTGIVYNGVNVYAGSSFNGVSGVTTFTQLSGTSPAKVRLASVTWALALPPGYWDLSFDYTNLQYTTTGFGVSAQVVLNGGIPLTAIADAVPQPFTVPNGQIATSVTGSFEVVDTSPLTIQLLWTSGTGQFHVRQLTLTNQDVTTCRIKASGTLGGGTANVDVMGIAGQPETLLFEFNTVPQDPAVFQMTTEGDPGVDPLLPLQIKQITVQNVGTYTATPNSSGFQAWRQECVDRTERTVQHAYAGVVGSYGGNLPIFYSSGTEWSSANSEAWMSLIETRQPRLRELPTVQNGAIFYGRQYEVSSGGTVVYDSGTYATGDRFYAFSDVGTYTGNGTVKQVGAFVKAHAGHIGKPCLVPYGIELDGDVVTLSVAGSLAMPLVASCQPWMIDAGLYVVQPEFWSPEML